ncbi:MAG: hypothetical protein ACTHLV_23055, partial [Achromobacter mucicolens]
MTTAKIAWGSPSLAIPRTNCGPTPYPTAHVAQSKNHFDEFEAHTLLKHTVLKAYLQTWARKMLL